MKPIRNALLAALLVTVSAAGVTGCRTLTAGAAPGTADTGRRWPARRQPARADPRTGTCHLRSSHGQPLPDPHCTPGATNPQVTQVNIDSTICRPGWTKTIRPPVAVTNRIKTATLRAYGLPAGTQGELDHLVSLELGGAPEDPRNLWVEPGRIPNPKDAVEARAHKAVCEHRVSLAAAQAAITSDWTTD